MSGQFIPDASCLRDSHHGGREIVVESVPASLVSDGTLWQTGRYAELCSRLRGKLSQAEADGDRQSFIASANDLACAYRVLGDHETAAFFQLVAATRERQSNALHGGRISENSLGNLACDAVLSGNLAIAEGLLWKSLLAELAAGNELGAASDWANLGLIAGLLGDLPTAKQRLWWAVKLHRRHRDELHLALDLSHLGQLFEIDGEWNRSRKLFHRARDLFHKIGHQHYCRVAESQLMLNTARAAVLTFDVRRN